MIVTVHNTVDMHVLDTAKNVLQFSRQISSKIPCVGGIETWHSLHKTQSFSDHLTETPLIENMLIKS